MSYKSNNNVIYSCKYHVVWCPKYRRHVLKDKIAKRLKELLFQISKDNKSEIIELEIMEDHVHLLVEVDPQFGINNLMRLLKGQTSRVLRSEFLELRKRLPTLWSNSYFVSTAGGAPLELIKQYIQNQQQSESIKSKTRWTEYIDNGKRDA